MAFAPIAFIAPQYSEQPFYWLKAYVTGTTTPLVIATDAGAITQLSKAQLDASGFPTTDGSTVFIPYIDGAYDLYLFPTETDADNNNTVNGIRIALNQVGSSGGTGSAGGTNLLNVETQSLTDGQTVVVFTSELSYASFYINDPDSDNGRLVENTDYTVDTSTSTVTLTQSYPSGTQLTAAFNEVGSSLTNPIIFDTVEAAKGSTAIIGTYITTRGKDSTGDGRHASYIKVASGTGTDDGEKFIDMDDGNQLQRLNIGPLALVDGISEPATITGLAYIYVDTADGDLKVKFGDGTIKTIVTDS